MKKEKRNNEDKAPKAGNAPGNNAVKNGGKSNNPGGQSGGKNQKNKFGQNGGNKNGGGKAKNNAEDSRKDTYAYALDGNLYINLTNKCSNACDFCVRNERTSYYGHYLWIRHGDPTAEKVIAAINGMGDLSKFKEVVFCGFGEPTYKIAEMSAVADYVHSKGIKTRLNTNGQGNLINKRDIVPELKGKIDKINISLNAASAEKYQPICRSMFGEAGYTSILDFARLCRRSGIECWFSVVDCIGEAEVSACKRVADSVGIPLRVRGYIADS